MNTFEVTIEKVITQTLTITAEDEDEAMKIAETKCNTGEIIPKSGKLVSRQMMIRNPKTQEESSWVDF